jgi:hypothetical protein
MSINFDKNGVGYILGDLVSFSSGRPRRETLENIVQNRAQEKITFFHSKTWDCLLFILIPRGRLFK